MKKLYALALLLVTAFGARAQEAVYETNIRSVNLPKSSGMASPFVITRDTVFPGFLDNVDTYCGTITLYCSPGGLTPAGNCRAGFRSGNNQEGDREMLTKYWRPGENGTVVGVFIRTGGKTQTTAATPTYAVVYGVDSMGLPDTLNRTVSTALPMSRVSDGTAYTNYVFANTPLYTDSLFVGMVLPQALGDTIGIFTSRLGGTGHPAHCSANYPNRAFVRKGDGSFVLSRYRHATAFPGEVELVMATIFEFDRAIATKDLLGKLVKVTPVPAFRTLNVALPNNIKGATSWQLMTSDGRVASQSAGKTDSPFIEIERGNLPAGVYTLRLNTVAGPVTKRVVFAD